MFVISLNEIIVFFRRSTEVLFVVRDIYTATGIVLNDGCARIFVNYLWIIIINRWLDLLLLLMILLLIIVILKSILIILIDNIAKLIILKPLIGVIVNLNILPRPTLHRSALRLIRTVPSLSKIVFSVASGF